VRPIKLTVQAFGPYAAEQVFDFAALEGRSFFLIHGPTGAGKTSILDAIFFALYGVASGARDPREMRSDHAKADCPTEVTFDFSIGADRYRIRRQPEQERRSKQKGGTSTVVAKPTATLWKSRFSRPGRGASDNVGASADGAVLEDGVAKVNDRVERLLGFKVDQFRQVVMLPQGMFQKLLLSNSADREKILEALFAVENYGQIEAALKAATAQMKREREDTAKLQRETLRAAGVEQKVQLVIRRSETETLRAAAEGEVEALRAAKLVAQEALAAARQVAERISERERAKAEMAKLAARRAEFAQKQVQYQSACKAATLVQFEEEVIRRMREAGAAVERLELAKKALELATKARVEADALLERETTREPEREAARQQVLRLEQLAEKVRELAAAAKAVGDAQQEAERANKARVEGERSLAKARTLVEAEQKRAAELEAAFAQLTALVMRVKESQAALDSRKALEARQKELAESTARLDKTRAALPRVAQNLAWARQTLDDHQARWNRGQAALLARSLQTGEPCPVCGALDHPQPAHSAEELPSEDRLRQATEAVDRLTKEHGELQADLARQEAELAAVSAVVSQLGQTLGMRIDKPVHVLEDELKALEVERERAEDAGIKLDTARHAVDSAKAQEVTATARLAQADALLVTVSGNLKAAQAILADRENAVPKELRGAGALDRERQRAAELRKRLEDALTAARKQAEEAAISFTGKRADVASATQLADATRTTYEMLRQQFRDRCLEAGFADHAAFKAAKLTDDALEALDGEIRDYHVAIQSAKERLERAQSAAPGNLAAPDLAQLTTADSTAQQALEAKINQAAQLAQQIKTIDAALARLTELESKLASLDEQYLVIGAVADAANGKNDYNMTFQRYVLGVFLDEVLNAATLRLRTMSRGRFLLGRVTETASGRGAAGLDLQVHDTHTSTLRPVSTLSGGESFLASLSLALGLADVVQSYAGGIRLETIFIDEGFGTLDPESLDLAIRALRDLQKGGRLVGIISHVTELREWIDARLEVTAGRSGSVARFVIA
jgi:exonuclease SbcC